MQVTIGFHWLGVDEVAGCFQCLCAYVRVVDVKAMQPCCTFWGRVKDVELPMFGGEGVGERAGGVILIKFLDGYASA